MQVALIYRSKSTFLPGAEKFRDTLEDIKSQADFNNQKYNVTGFLLYSNGYFYQILEGGFHGVGIIFSKILSDKRHFDIELISYAQVPDREFYEWSMNWSIDLLKSRSFELGMKISLLHDYVNKFGMAKPLLRDIISRIARDFADSSPPPPSAVMPGSAADAPALQRRAFPKSPLSS